MYYEAIDNVPATIWEERDGKPDRRRQRTEVAIFFVKVFLAYDKLVVHFGHNFDRLK